MEQTRHTHISPYVYMGLEDPIKRDIRLNFRKPEGSLSFIVATICDKFCITDIEFKSAGRTGQLCRARAAYCWLAKECTNFYWRQISEAMNRDHSTAMYNYEEACNRFLTDKIFKQTLLTLKDKICLELGL